MINTSNITGVLRPIISNGKMIGFKHFTNKDGMQMGIIKKVKINHIGDNK